MRERRAMMEDPVVDVVIVALKLAVIRNMMPPDKAGVVLELQTGQRPVLRRTHKDFDYYLRLARDSFRDRLPVAIGIRDNEAQRMMLAERDTVRELTDDGHGNLKIWFQAHDGTFRLDASAAD